MTCVYLHDECLYAVRFAEKRIFSDMEGVNVFVLVGFLITDLMMMDLRKYLHFLCIRLR